MDSPSIYVSYLADFSDPKPKTRTLSEIVDEVRDGTHANLIQQIRTQPKRDRNELKKRLPQFFPTIVLGRQNKLTEDAIPTGIVQFDVDLQDNEATNFDDLKQVVISIPECIYAFTSPSGGLKFGILTDFAKDPDDNLTSLKQRYRKAYKIAHRHVSQFVEVQHDSSMEALKFPCYLSWDPAAYFNPSCSLLPVNAECVYEPPKVSQLANDVVGMDQIEEILRFIPQDFGYAERLPVNFAVFNCIGEAGIPLLYQHWITDSREKLRKDLENQCRSGGYGSFGHLVNVAKNHGYMVPTGRARKNLKARPVDFSFPPLVTVEEGTEQLRSIVHDFFESGHSTFINITAGSGKTEIALEVLKSIPWNKRVLYLVKDHSLAEEIVQRFKQFPTGPKTTLRKRYERRSSIVHIQGKERMCEMPEYVEAYRNAGVVMPVDQCFSCPQEADCQYINQFRTPFQNIRLMTHNELVNHQSAWFHGTSDGKPVKKKKLKAGADGQLHQWTGWKPDYIIVDEDWLTKQDHIETLNSDFPSIRNIINDMLNGTPLKDAVNQNGASVLYDHHSMESSQPRKPKFDTMKQYLSDLRNQPKNPDSEILTRLKSFVLTDDESLLRGMRLNGKALVLSTIIQTAERYRGIPTLYLDATANPSVVKAVLPDVGFHAIKIQGNPESNVYQLENSTITKKWLTTEENRTLLVSGLRKLASRYNKVGLITYLNVEDFDGPFDQWLAGKLGITTFGHFGALRGQDAFKGVDCLLIVGRHQLPKTALQSYTYAVFGDVDNWKTGYADVPIRMKDGSVMSVGNYVPTDSRVDAIHQHFSTAETIQAVGRARLIHGISKDVYLFSNETLGADVEITAFFRFDDWLGQPKYQQAVEKLKQLGFCQNKQSELQQKLGLPISAIKQDRSGIDTAFLAAGIQKETVTFRDKYRKQREQEYYVYNKDRLSDFLTSQGCKVVAIGKKSIQIRPSIATQKVHI